jgi:4-amino-4-deoxy-L-arabinose transferase-like glycosyltransferase
MRPNETKLNVRAYYFAFAVLSAIALLAPIRAGDLPGYDDALYSDIAREIVTSGDWLNLRINGLRYLQHGPLLEWMQAVLFSIFGPSDPMAKLPSALCGLGAILLVGWLGRRLTGNPLIGLLATFVLATSAYFVKYSAHAMTDVPVTFFFLAAICAWSLKDEDPRWYLASGVFTAFALMTRELAGCALPVIFGIHLLIERRRPPVGYAVASLAIAIIPLAAWYARAIHLYGAWVFAGTSVWMDQAVAGALSPAWRRYTGIFEYAWMLAKSYWPWLPFTIAGTAALMRRRDPRLLLLIVWPAVVALVCAAVSSRVLRYMLPAYPAFSILAAIGLVRVVPLGYIRSGLRVLTPLLATAVIAIAVFPPEVHHAAEIRPVAVAAASVTPPNGRIVFYDAGPPRYDETNQILWYSGRNVLMMFSPDELGQAMRERPTLVFVVDSDTYRKYFDSRTADVIVAQSGHLMCVRLAP